MAFPAVAPRALLFVWFFNGLLFANAARDEDRSEVSSLVMVSSGHMIATSRKAATDAVLENGNRDPTNEKRQGDKEAKIEERKQELIAAKKAEGGEIDENVEAQAEAQAKSESEAAHKVNQMVPVWTDAGAKWAKSAEVETKVKAAVAAKEHGVPDPTNWEPEDGKFVNAQDRAAIAVALDAKPGAWETVSDNAYKLSFPAGAEGTPIIEEKIADDAGVSMSDIDDLGRPDGAYGTPEWYAHQTPLAIEMAANQNINRIAAPNNNLRKLADQYTDMKSKWQDSADKVWKEGKNVGEIQTNKKAGGENFIQATGHYWMNESQTFRTAAADMRKHADEVYADIVKSHEVAGHQQLRSFKEEIAKLDPVFKRHTAIYDLVHPPAETVQKTKAAAEKETQTAKVAEAPAAELSTEEQEQACNAKLEKLRAEYKQKINDMSSDQKAELRGEDDGERLNHMTKDEGLPELKKEFKDATTCHKNA